MNPTIFIKSLLGGVIGVEVDTIVNGISKSLVSKKAKPLIRFTTAVCAYLLSDLVCGVINSYLETVIDQKPDDISESP